MRSDQCRLCQVAETAECTHVEEVSTGLDACLRAPSSVFALGFGLGACLGVNEDEDEAEGAAFAVADVLPLAEAAAADIVSAGVDCGESETGDGVVGA